METLFQKIPLYFDDELSIEERASFKEAIKQHPTLAQKVEAYRLKLIEIDMLENEHDMEQMDYDTTIQASSAEIAAATEYLKKLPQVNTLPSSPTKPYGGQFVFISILLVAITVGVAWCRHVYNELARRQVAQESLAKYTTKNLPAPPRDTTRRIARDTTKKTLPTPPSRQEPKTDTNSKKNLPAIPAMPAIPTENFEPKNQGLEAQAQAGGLKGKKFIVISPQKEANLQKEALFKWENEQRKGIYKITILDRYGEKYMLFDSIASIEPTTSLLIKLMDFESALYYWKLEHTEEELPFIGKFFVRKP